MVIKHLGTIAEALIRHGRDPQEPAALISRATTAGQDVLVSTLGNIAEAAGTRGMAPPAILVSGHVVGLRKTLRWLSPTDVIDYAI